MDDQQFDELTAKVLAGTASPQEQSTLEAICQQDESRRKEYASFQATMKAVAAGGAAAQALDEIPAEAPELPRYRMEELRTAVRQEFGATKIKDKSRSVELSFSAYLKRWLLPAMALFVSAGLTIYILLPTQAPPTIVQVGLFGEILARGGGLHSSSLQSDQTEVMSFQREMDYDKWIEQGLAEQVMAKIWINEEDSMLEILWKTPQTGVIEKIKEGPLPSSQKAKHKRLEALIHTLRNQQPQSP